MFRVAKRTANSNACSLAIQSLTISPVRLLVGERKLQAKSGQGTWFGTRGSEVQILSPRPYLIDLVDSILAVPASF
jgi:hypothetical protein